MLYYKEIRSKAGRIVKTYQIYDIKDDVNCLGTIQWVYLIKRFCFIAADRYYLDIQNLREVMNMMNNLEIQLKLDVQDYWNRKKKHKIEKQQS